MLHIRVFVFLEMLLQDLELFCVKYGPASTELWTACSEQGLNREVVIISVHYRYSNIFLSICLYVDSYMLPLELALSHSLVVGAPRYRTDLVLIPAQDL